MVNSLMINILYRFYFGYILTASYLICNSYFDFLARISVFFYLGLL